MNTCLTEQNMTGGRGGDKGGPEQGCEQTMRQLHNRASHGVCRTASGGACIRNIKAPLPNIDRNSGSASLAVALAIGIAMSSLGGIFLCIAIIILYKWRKVCSTLSVGTPVSFRSCCECLGTRCGISGNYQYTW